MPCLATRPLPLAQAGLTRAWTVPMAAEPTVARRPARREALPAGVLPGAGPEADPPPQHGGAMAPWRAGFALPDRPA